MTLDPRELERNPERIEAIESATMRLVTQALYEYREQAQLIFAEEPDLVADIGEDITREALDRIGMSKIDVRLFGKIDYKRARYIFHPEWSVRQALFVDSKAEGAGGRTTATIQTGQTSMHIRQLRGGVAVNELGGLPPVYVRDGIPYITTTIFVKYTYTAVTEGGRTRNRLVEIKIVGLPNGWLQDRYNPDTDETIWLAGRNAPSRGERFRVRVSFPRLKAKTSWRVQTIRLHPTVAYTWEE